MSLEKRIVKLERQNKIMKLLLALTALIGVGVAAVQPSQNTLLLTSPNGQYKVLIKATDTCAGIWASGDASGSVSTFVNDEKSGAVVGVYGPKINGDWRNMDAAITSNKEDGGYLMLANPDRSDHKFFTGK